MFEWLLSWFGIERITITLKLEKREGGYIFISSPELKGFNLLLAPGNYNDFKEFVDAVHEPLTTYINAYQRAKKSARARQEALRLYATRIKEGPSMIATMCFQ